jgi:uncharacterized protein
MDLIIYHDDCADGFCAAYVAHKKWPNATFLPQNYGVEPPYEAVTGKDVLVLDFSWDKREVNEKLAGLAKSFRILDHHKMAKETLADLPFAMFDVTRSGAGLTWDELFGKEETIGGGVIVPGVPRPWYVDYAEDRDLWRWALPRSKAINAYMGAVKREFGVWKNMVERITPEQAAVYGSGSLRQIEHYVRQGVKQAQTGKLIFVDEEGFVHEHSVAVINCLITNFSELGGELADLPGIDVALGWFERTDGMIQFGLRAHKGVDAGKLAKAKGGGGHKQSAGFELSVKEGRELIDAILGRSNGESAKVFYEPMKFHRYVSEVEIA